MNVLIFIVVIVALIVVHEFGHFVAAKLSKMRVDEFGLGYPPRAAVIGRIGETILSLNWLPFGGFVKIFGEDGEPAGGSQTSKNSGSLTSSAADPRAFSSKNRFAQAFVLVAGVTMNLLFAYVLITGALIAGTPRALSQSEIAHARDVELAIANVLPSSPAARAGLLPGDSIITAKYGLLSSQSDSLQEWHAADSLDKVLGTSVSLPKSFSAFIAASGGEEVLLNVHRNGAEQTIIATPAAGVAASDPTRYALGVEVVTIGVVPLSFGAAVVEGASLTWGTVVATAVGLWHFFYGVFTLSADLSQVAGPVGIAGAVGAASASGLGNLFSIMAVISINLALINLIPVPALDGGRLLFVIIESVIRRPIKPSIARAVNAVGFLFLILLMLVVTAHDIFRIVG